MNNNKCKTSQAHRTLYCIHIVDWIKQHFLILLNCETERVTEGKQLVERFIDAFQWCGTDFNKMDILGRASLDHPLESVDHLDWQTQEQFASFYLECLPIAPRPCKNANNKMR